MLKLSLYAVASVAAVALTAYAVVALLIDAASGHVSRDIDDAMSTYDDTVHPLELAMAAGYTNSGWLN